jgi:hypothetical protein
MRLLRWISPLLLFLQLFRHRRFLLLEDGERLPDERLRLLSVLTA